MLHLYMSYTLSRLDLTLSVFRETTWWYILRLTDEFFVYGLGLRSEFKVGLHLFRFDTSSDTSDDTSGDTFIKRIKQYKTFKRERHPRKNSILNILKSK